MTELYYQPSFAAGEIGPQLYGRIDQELYYIGLRTARNFIIRQYGGAANRMGSKIVAECKKQDKYTRLIPFTFNEAQTYALAFGDLYMRVIKDGAEVLETAQNITAITKANPGVITIVGHGLSNGQDVYLTGIVGMVELNGRSVRVANVTADTFEITDYLGSNINTSGYTTYVSGGTAARIYTLTTPWTSDDLFDLDDNACLNYAQSNDVLTVVHNDYYPRDITRTDHNAWTIGEFANSQGPFKDTNTTAITLQASAVTGSITLTASAPLFSSAWEGELIYIEQESTDTTKKWEVNAGIRNSDIRRAGAHFYQAPTAAATTKTITGITAAAPGVVTTSAAHGLATDDVIYISGVVGMTEVNGKFFKIRNRTATTFQLLSLSGSDFSTSGFTAWSSGGTVEVAQMTGTVRPDHIEGSAKDGDPGVTWTYLHSGFGIAEITTYSSTTVVNATVINRLPESTVSGTTDIWARSAWSSTEGHPTAVAYHKGRMIFAGTESRPNNIDFSGVGLRTYFGHSNPLLDDDAFALPLNTTGSNAVRHLIPLAELLALTAASEHLINGVDDSLLATELPFNKVQGYTGASRVKPLIINNTALFVQDMGNMIRSLQYQLDADAFGGIDLTARSPHLFQGKFVVDWDYQRYPFSTVWTIMDDGSLNGFTFMEEQKVYAWHRHDSALDAKFESVCCIREGRETAAYFVVNRTIDGVERRFIERMASRELGGEVRNGYFVDCGGSYDGRNTAATTITITGGTNWDDTETLTLTASAAIFAQTDEDNNNQIVFWDGDTAYRFTIQTFNSTTVVLATPSRTVPVAYRSTARADWEFAKKVFRPFNHLEGEAVVALVDGNYVDGLTVSNGAVTLDTAGAVVHIGLPYVCDLETLDIAHQKLNIHGKPAIIPRVFFTVEESRAFYVSTNGLNEDDSLTDKDGKLIREIKQRTPAMGYDSAIPAETTTFEVLVDSAWSRNGRVALRHVYPTPVTINQIRPEVAIGQS